MMFRPDPVSNPEMRGFLHPLRVLSPTASRRVPVWPVSREPSACIRPGGDRTSKRADSRRDRQKRPIPNENYFNLWI